MKILFDTNVLFAAVIAKAGTCNALYDLCANEHEILTSPYLLAELRRKLETKAKFDEEALLRTFHFLIETTTLIPDPKHFPAVCRDPADDPVLAAALKAKADLLVTGDQDLLVLHPHGNLPILTPRQAFDKLTSRR